jgi:hypothetical protein
MRYGEDVKTISYRVRFRGVFGDYPRGAEILISESLCGPCRLDLRQARDVAGISVGDHSGAPCEVCQANGRSPRPCENRREVRGGESI